MAIYCSNYLYMNKGDIFRFARLLGSQDDIERAIKKIEERLSEKEIEYHNGIKIYKSVPSLKKLMLSSKESFENEIKKLDEFKSRDDISYRYKSNEEEISRIVKEFIDINGNKSMYKLNLYSNNFNIINLETNDIECMVDSESDETGDYYRGTYLTFFYTCADIHDYDKNRSNIRLDKGNIVYDNNSLVLMTDEYDLILEVIQRSPKKDNSTVFIEIDGEDF